VKSGPKSRNSVEQRELTFRRTLLKWSKANFHSFPWRETSDPYSVLIGELLLQRTRRENVTPVYKSFLARWPSADALSKAHPAALASAIRPLGLSKRAGTLKSLGRELTSMPSIPTDPKALQQLPGVGPYASNAVAIFARGRNLPLVDWVIARVLRRYFGLPSRARPNQDAALWATASSLASRGTAGRLWLATLDFAAAVCRPRPRCDVCPLASSCRYARSLPQPA
jgi:A/G-specific adenine glycosylase